MLALRFVMARASLEILEKLMEEQRPPNEGEYKKLVDELMVHHQREHSDGPIEHGIVWPLWIVFNENDNVQTRIDKMARKIYDSEEILNQIEENNSEISGIISDALDSAARATRSAERRRDRSISRANSGRSRSPETR